MITLKNYYEFNPGIKILTVFALIGVIGLFLFAYAVSANGISALHYAFGGRNMSTEDVAWSIKLIPSALICSVLCIYFMAPRIRKFLLQTAERTFDSFASGLERGFEKVGEFLDEIF